MRSILITIFSTFLFLNSSDATTLKCTSLKSRAYLSDGSNDYEAVNGFNYGLSHFPSNTEEDTGTSFNVNISERLITIITDPDSEHIVPSPKLDDSIDIGLDEVVTPGSLHLHVIITDPNIAGTFSDNEKWKDNSGKYTYSRTQRANVVIDRALGAFKYMSCTHDWFRLNSGNTYLCFAAEGICKPITTQK